jgi:hypothetical protein
MRLMIAVIAAAAAACGPARSQVEELFSRHVQVFRPQGEFARQLIRSTPPSGAGWREVSDRKHGYRLMLPAEIEPDTEPQGTRTLRAVFTELQVRPKPVLRVDVFPAQEGDPETVDQEYVEALVEQYPEQAFEGRFTVTDSGLVVRNKQPLALIGGTFTQGAAQVYRLQWCHLDRERQVFVTFDCAEGERERYEETVARILLSFAAPRAK